MKNNKLVNIILYVILILGLFAYEIHIYNYYTYIQIILFVLIFLASVILLKNKEFRIEVLKLMKKNTSILILGFLMLMNTLFSLLFFHYANLSIIPIVILYLINIFSLFLVMPVYFKNNKNFSDKFISFYIKAMIPICIFGIVLFFNDGLLGYTLEGNRSGSIYFDSNFFAIIASLPCILVFKKEDCSKIFKIFIFLLSIVSIFVSGSRGTMLSLVLCILYFIFVKYPNKKIIKKTLLITCVLISGIIFFNNIDNISFLRIDQGSHGRLEMILFALKRLKKSPIFGFGYGSISVVLKEVGFANSNTHNSLVDFAFRYGFVPLVLYLYIIFKSFYFSMVRKENLYLNLMLILLFINMNTILYSFGGVGLPSMAMTLCMGLSCYKSVKNNNERCLVK